MRPQGRDWYACEVLILEACRARMAQASPRQREVATLRLFKRMSWGQIAKRLGIKRGSAQDYYRAFWREGKGRSAAHVAGQ